MPIYCRIYNINFNVTESKSSLSGLEKCSYIFWQPKYAHISLSSLWYTMQHGLHYFTSMHYQNLFPLRNGIMHCRSISNLPFPAHNLCRGKDTVVNVILKSSVADPNPDPPDPPNPHVLAPPGSGSISQRYGSGSGSFYYQAKVIRKNLDSYCFLTSFWLFISAGSESISQRHGSTDPDPDPHQNVMDPQHC